MRRKDAAATQGAAQGRLMARQIVNIENLAEAQEAAHAAMEAAQIAAEKMAEAMAVVASEPQLPEVVTSLRPPALMIGLKSLAVRKRKTVNDVIVDAIKKHLALGQPL
jgi:hypothetical protein